ncbi:AAA family ATPase [Rothia aerolata]|uniref:ATPase AAA n=1 Tax=Rothia aerolata TaxID=1812262 RepID=A0A917IXL5_9MICC|nr:AAA family ATPase [Rothia aerolata]GGH64658.1 ATPase AAA [Rothia aerolata]
MNAQPTVEYAGVAYPLKGRDAELSAFEARFDTGNWSTPVVVTGPAGIGKTALVKAFEAIACERGWRALYDAPSKGLTQRMSGIYLPGIHENLTGKICDDFDCMSLEEQLKMVAEGLQTLGEGLLITIDTLPRGAAANLRELVSAVVRVTELGLPVQLVLAGRGQDARDLLAAEGMEALASAEQIDLGALTRAQTEETLRQVWESCRVHSGKTCEVTQELLQRASLATYGYPYMVQLVGERIRRKAVDQQLTEEQLICELAAAQEALGALVLGPLLEKLSAGDRAFLEAMAEDDSSSKMSDIAARLGKNPQYAGVYRNRLVEAQIIRAASYGKVTFVIPHLRDYLRAHRAEDSFDTF